MNNTPMDGRIKNLLGLVITFAVAVAAIGIISYVSSFAKSVEPSAAFRTFTATAEGKKVAVPDIARFTFSIITEGGQDLQGLQNQNSEKANKAIAFLKEQGIDAKDIQTESYNITPRSQYFDCSGSGGRPCPPPTIVGYTVTQSVSVKIRDFAKISGTLAGVVNNGANSVSQLTFAIDDPSKIENEARAEAIAKAKERAQEIAEAGGFKLGRLLSIAENGSYPPPYYTNARGSLELDSLKAVGAPAPAVEPGSQEVTVTVNVQYEIR